MTVQSVKHKSDNSNTTTTTTACLHFLVMSPGPYFSLLWFPEHNSTTINMSVVLGKIIDQVNAECRMEE